MSNLSMLPISDLKKIFDLNVMIETGTEGGYGVEVGLRAGFEEVYSCEVIEKNYFIAQKKFGGYENVHLFRGTSKDMLPIMLDSVGEEQVLFWLDAHLPNCFDLERDYSINDILPLEDEVEIIKNHEVHNCDNDVICIDDLCLLDEKFRGADFDLQRWTGNKGARDMGVDTIIDIFSNHIWYRDDRADGILIGFPNIDNSEIKQLIDQNKWVRI